MKRETLRFVLALAMFSIAGIISIQIYWFSRAFDIRDKQFNQTVNIILREVVNQILTYNGSTVHHAIPVEQLSSNYFVAMVNSDIDANLLETLLVNEFKARELLVDFEYGIYNCVNEKMVFGNSVRLQEKSSKSHGEGQDRNPYQPVAVPLKIPVGHVLIEIILPQNKYSAEG